MTKHTSLANPETFEGWWSRNYPHGDEVTRYVARLAWQRAYNEGYQKCVRDELRPLRLKHGPEGMN